MEEKQFKSGEVYDLMYQNKDYEKEFNFIESFFPYKPKKILELGCGTGKYTEILLKKGYNTLSLDLSEEMLEIARKKIPNGKFIQGDIKNLNLNEKYDACLLLFAVLGYITENKHLENVFQNIKAHLNPGGFLIFDVWNGLAVLNEKPEERVKEVENEKIKVSRYATPELNAEKHICDVNYKFFIKDKITGIINKINEVHRVRFFFPQELKKYLEDSGFEILKICPSFESNSMLDENSWHMTVIVKLKK
jgi:SAM-dependent methyltransferase